MTTRTVLLSAAVMSVLAACQPQTTEIEPETASIKTAALNPDAQCKPATGIFDFLVQLGTFDDWSDSPVKPMTIAQFTPLDGKPVPTLLIYRFDDVDTQMPVYEDNKILFNASALDPDGGGELCIVDPARKDSPPGGLDFNLNIEFVFKQGKSRYPVADLIKGANTTTAYFARTLGAASGDNAVSPYGPTDWSAVSKPEGFDGDWTAPAINMMRGDTTVLTPTPADGEKTVFVSLEAIQASGADEMVIEDGTYKLAPIFDPSTLRKRMTDAPVQP